MLSWIFQHDYLDTYCFECLICMYFVYFCICTCSAQLSMFHMERRSRNTLIIIIIIIGTVTDRIGTQTTVRLLRKIGLYPSLCNHRHTLNALRYFFPKKPEQIIFFEPREVQTVFHIFSFSCEGSFVNLRNVFRLIASGVNTDASTWLLPPDWFRTYSQT